MFTRPRVFMLLSAILLCAANARAATEDLGNGFQHHGVATPVSNHRGAIYILFVKGIGRLDPRTYEVTLLAESPVPVGPGGDILNGRIYFASGSHLYSYAVPE